MKVTIQAQAFNITIEAPDGKITMSGPGIRTHDPGSGTTCSEAKETPKNDTAVVTEGASTKSEHWKPGKCPGCGEKLTRPGRWVIAGPEGLVHIRCRNKKKEPDEEKEVDKEMIAEQELENDIEDDTEDYDAD